MGRSARRGAREETFNRKAWSVDEDMMLSAYIQSHGEGRWAAIPLRTGLQRSGKSCRLRWFNYLRPNIKLGNISAEEKEVIIRLHGLVGNRWSLIARQLPGRTDNEIKNYWNTRLKKEINSSHGIQSPPAGDNTSHQTTAADPNLIEKPLAETTNTSNPVNEATLDEILSAITSNDCRSSADDQSYSNVETIMTAVDHDDDKYYRSGVMLTPVIHGDEAGFTLNPVIAQEMNEWSKNSAVASTMNEVDYILPQFSDDYTAVQEGCSLFFFN